jgi:hypothetical protein
MGRLTYEGEEWALDVLLRGADNTVPLYFGLYTDASEPAKAATLASGLTEVAVGSYARALVERSSVGWPLLQFSVDRFKAISKNVEFPAPTADYTARGLFLTDAASGTSGVLIATYHLSGAASAVNGGPPLVFSISQPVTSS